MQCVCVKRTVRETVCSVSDCNTPEAPAQGKHQNGAMFVCTHICTCIEDEQQMQRMPQPSHAITHSSSRLAVLPHASHTHGSHAPTHVCKLLFQNQHVSITQKRRIQNASVASLLAKPRLDITLLLDATSRTCSRQSNDVADLSLQQSQCNHVM